MDSQQLRDLIRRVLKQANLIKYEDEREIELLMLTAAVESNLGQYIRQKGGGPALGIFQMEPETEEDLCRNYIDYRPELGCLVEDWTGSVFREDELEWNLAYQILMARIHYLRKPEKIPAADDVEGLAIYWKNHYNSYLGKGTVIKAIKKYNKYVK